MSKNASQSTVKKESPENNGEQLLGDFSLSGRESIIPSFPKESLGNEPTPVGVPIIDDPERRVAKISLPSTITGRESAIQATHVQASNGSEITVISSPQVVAPTLGGREPTRYIFSAGTPRQPIQPMGRERTLTDTPITLHGESTAVTGRERTVTDTPITLYGSPATIEETGLERTPGTSTVTKRPKTLGISRPITGNGTSVNFDDAWHLQGRKGPFTGQTWGDFDIGGILGEGGMGAVYRARQSSLYRRVGLKILPPSLAADKQLLERFMLEARTASTMQSPHIVQVYAIGEHEGNHYFAMEYVEGTDLYEVMKSRKEVGNPLSVDESADYIMQAAKGLAEAGRHGIVHRDIKPPNLMVTRKDNLVKIADFGIVKVMGEHQLTLTGQAIGTPAYVSPEQGRGDREIDQRSDIYSLGIVFYELLCGKKPFEGTTPSALIYQHCYDEPTLPQKLNVLVSNEYQTVVLKCLQKKPEKRYQNADELVADLLAIKTGDMMKSALANFKGTGADEARREQMNWFQRNLFKAVLAAGLIMLGAGASAYWYLGQYLYDKRAIVDHRNWMRDQIQNATPVPQGADARMVEIEKLVNSDDSQVVELKEKWKSVQDWKENLRQLEDKEKGVTALLRSSAPRMVQELSKQVGTADDVVEKWNDLLKHADEKEQNLRDKLSIVDTSNIFTKALRDQLIGDLEQLKILVKEGDHQVLDWERKFNQFDETYKKLIDVLTRLDSDVGFIVQKRIGIYDDSLSQIQPLLGEGDPNIIRWKAKIEASQEYIDGLRDHLNRLDTQAALHPSTVLQMQVKPDLDALAHLTDSDDSQVKEWRKRIVDANSIIDDLTKSIAKEMLLIKPGSMIPIARIASIKNDVEQLEILKPDDKKIGEWKSLIENSERDRDALILRLQHLEPTYKKNLSVAEQSSLRSDLERLDRDKAGKLNKTRHAKQWKRLEDERERVVGLRQRLCSLNDANPITQATRNDFVQLSLDDSDDKVDVPRWKKKIARVDSLIRQLESLKFSSGLVPSGCQELYRQLVEEVGDDDEAVISFRPRYKQIIEVEEALRSLDVVSPLPDDVDTQLKRFANLFGKGDLVYIKRQAKVDRVRTLKENCRNLDAVVAVSALERKKHEQEFSELVSLIGVTDAEIPQFARRMIQLIGPTKPRWAFDSGRDEYGLWADLTVDRQSIRMRYCPPGHVALGSRDDEPGHEPDEVPVIVSLTKGFWIAESECTQSLWIAMMTENPSYMRGLQRPVERVNYDDCNQFLAKLSSRFSGLVARLPSEVEWEYACRAHVQTPWSAARLEDAVADKVAWSKDNSANQSHDVKLRFPNPLGLYDMHGNVWEWCEDRYGAYPTSAVKDWRGKDGVSRIARGGSWGDATEATRAANRLPVRADLRSAYLGFRVCIDAEKYNEKDEARLIAHILQVSPNMPEADALRQRLELPLGAGKLAIEIEWPQKINNEPAHSGRNDKVTP